MDSITVELEDLQELAAEIRAVHKRVHEWDNRNRRKERRMLELLDALANYFGIQKPLESEILPGTLLEAKAQALRAALWASRGSKQGAARILGVNVKTVFNLMRQTAIPMSFGRRARLPQGTP